MTAKIFEFKPKPATPMHSLYLVVQEACNWATFLQQRAFALAAEEAIDAATCVTLSAEAQKLRAQQIVSVKYDAQLAEQRARNVSETLPYRGADFSSDINFVSRQLHALEAEVCAIEAQLTCVRLIADAAERDGQERPVGEFDFLTVKAERKQAEASALQEKLARLSASASGSAAITVDQPRV